MVSILVENEVLLNALMEQVEFWTDEEDVIKLFKKMYEEQIEEGLFNDDVFNAEDIVEEDMFGDERCRVMYPDDKDYKKVVYTWNELEEAETDNRIYIEAEDNGLYLVRRF